MHYLMVLITFASVGTVWPYRSNLTKKYDGYGEDWMFIPDGKGELQVAVLKGDVNEIRETLLEPPISYILYTRSNPQNGIKFFSNDTTGLRKSPFSAKKKTKFITHGWKSSASSSAFVAIKDAYLKNFDYNVFLVDWEPLAASTFYLGPMQNTAKVGADAARFIDLTVKQTGLKTKHIHFIGHSLGAHVAGNTGYSMKSGRLGRITGLDPAFPVIHKFATIDGRLDSTDATFVDVIHSCGGILGFFDPLGHADFYPNAGVPVQPGCCCLTEIIEACSHARSYLYFTESISTKTGFLSKQCSDWDTYKTGQCDSSYSVPMGEHVHPSTKGTFFLRTKSSSPFALTEKYSENKI